jgi:hypothetical protein
MAVLRIGILYISRHGGPGDSAATVRATAEPWLKAWQGRGSASAVDARSPTALKLNLSVGARDDMFGGALVDWW